MKPKVCQKCPYLKVCKLELSPHSKLGFNNPVHCVYFKEYEKAKK